MPFEKDVKDLKYMPMKEIFLRLCKALLSFIGVAAVATSCDIVCEYGTPTMDYTVMGKVVNEKKEALQHIKVKGLHHDYWDGNLDSTYTSASGEFAITQQRITGFGEKASLVFEDESGVYRTDTVDVKLEQVKKGSGWYNGEFAAEDVEIVMKEK